MNANIKNILAYHKNKSLGRMFVTKTGRTLTDSEARAYLHWCVNNGFESLKEAPEFDDVKWQLTILE